MKQFIFNVTIFTSIKKPYTITTRLIRNKHAAYTEVMAEIKKYFPGKDYKIVFVSEK